MVAIWMIFGMSMHNDIVMMDGKQVTIEIRSLFRYVVHYVRQSVFLHRVSKKLCKIVFARTLSNFHQFWFDKFWQKDAKEAKIMRGALIFHLR